MTWFDWLLVVLLTLEATTYALIVNQPRKVVTPALASAQVLVDVFLILGVVFIR